MASYFRVFKKIREMNIRNTLWIVLFVNPWLIYSFAQDNPSPNGVGVSHYIASTILSEQRQIQVHLPASYDDTDHTYPVLYILDGQRFFLYGVSLMTTFKQYELTPEFITVCITNSYPQRFSHFSDGSKKFMGFLKSELIPFVEEHYRTTDTRLLFGWEYAGGFAFNLITKEPSLFDGYLLASPFPIDSHLSALDSLSELKTSLFFSMIPHEFDVNRGVDHLDSLLTLRNKDGLTWKYLKLVNEEHRSTPYPTLYHGLRNYFQYYPEMQVDDLSTFVEAGGMDFAYRYAKERSVQFGFEPELSTWTKFTIPAKRYAGQ